MKKLYILLTLILMLTACAQASLPTEAPTEASLPTEAPPATPVGDENTFILSSLPDIGEYDSGESERWYEEYTPDLIPGDDYGLLLPYAGGKKAYHDVYEGEEYEDTDSLYTVEYWSYGLCTEDGVVVTDPVYSYIELASEGYYILKKERVVPGEQYSERVETVYIAKTDGSTVEKVYEGTGYFYYVGGDLYSSWTDEGRYFTYKDGVKTPLDSSYSVIYEDGGYFCAYKEDGCCLLDMELNVVSGTHDIVRAANSEYYIFGEETDNTNLYGIARMGTGEAVVTASENDVEYEAGMFIIYDGSAISVYDDKMTLKSSFDTGEGGYMFTMGGKVICYVDEDYERRYFTSEGEEIKSSGYSYDYDSGYYIFNTALGTRICDSDLNEVTFIYGMEVYGAYPVEKGLLIHNSLGRFIYDTEQCLLTPVDSMDYGSYSIRLDSAGQKPILQVYNDGGEPLFRCYGTYTYSELAHGRLYHYISGGRAYTCREDGTVVLSVPTKE